MNVNKPVILISNDDGYHAKGINSLIDMLRDIAYLVVCAPESARSGFSFAFTAADPWRLKLRRKDEAPPSTVLNWLLTSFLSTVFPI